MTSIRKRKKEYKIRIIQLLLNPPTFNIGFGLENYTHEPESKRNAKLIAGVFLAEYSQTDTTHNKTIK